MKLVVPHDCTELGGRQGLSIAAKHVSMSPSRPMRQHAAKTSVGHCGGVTVSHSPALTFRQSRRLLVLISLRVRGRPCPEVSSKPSTKLLDSQTKVLSATRPALAQLNKTCRRPCCPTTAPASAVRS
jgi:hypothetical protein